MDSKICIKCEESKSINNFHTRFKWNKTKTKRLKSDSGICRKCRNRSTKIADSKRDVAERMRGYIKRGRKFDEPCDFKTDFARELLNKPCTYCGREGIDFMSLDRVDNSRGYVKDNVVPCCLRCNNMKSNLSIEAWNIISPAVKKAFEMGLLNEKSKRPLNI